MRRKRADGPVCTLPPTAPPPRHLQCRHSVHRNPPLQLLLHALLVTMLLVCLWLLMLLLVWLMPCGVRHAVALMARLLWRQLLRYRLWHQCCLCHCPPYLPPSRRRLVPTPLLQRLLLQQLLPSAWAQAQGCTAKPLEIAWLQ